MALVSDLLNQAFLDLGAIAPGDSNTTLELSDAFLRLNQLIKSWSTEQLTVPSMTHQSFAVTAGTDAYTLGPAGTLVTALRVLRVTGASSRQGNFRSAMHVMSFEQFAATIEDPMSSATVLAKVLAADGAFPLINLRVYPMPATGPGALWLDFWSAIPAFVAQTDAITLPEGWERALHLNLAVDLYPQYGRTGGIDPSLLGLAQASKASLVKLNADILGAPQAPPQGGGGQ
jgi:hypothetical protein